MTFHSSPSLVSTLIKYFVSGFCLSEETPLSKGKREFLLVTFWNEASGGYCYLGLFKHKNILFNY